ncbi:hypothetical protein GOODEAATRI_000227 [Goodea atripinnis]|uniref:Uncharacterized protein n=1 Tax=Goodea atripinnis TaxID=208336 RepID=A0ABV0MN75_9TELE
MKDRLEQLKAPYVHFNVCPSCCQQPPDLQETWRRLGKKETRKHNLVRVMRAFMLLDWTDLAFLCSFKLK